MIKVHNLKEAEELFLRNSGNLILTCVNNGEERLVECYPEAVKFYEELEGGKKNNG